MQLFIIFNLTHRGQQIQKIRQQSNIFPRNIRNDKNWDHIFCRCYSLKNNKKCTEKSTAYYISFITQGVLSGYNFFKYCFMLKTDSITSS